MKTILVDTNREMVEAWRELLPPPNDAHFKWFNNVEIKHGSIFDVECDAIVSPANSFGFMDGGLDMLISKHFGWHVQERVQDEIKRKRRGELLVGEAIVIPTDHAKVPYVISAPTMRVPMMLDKNVNAYLAMFGILDAADDEYAITKIAVPGLGTGVGRMPYKVCARQMMEAIKKFWHGTQLPDSWCHASNYHQWLYDSSRVRDLQF